MAHFKILCRYCNKIMGQCRCMNPDKEIRYDTCNECAKKIASTTQKEMAEKEMADKEWERLLKTWKF